MTGCFEYPKTIQKPIFLFGNIKPIWHYADFSGQYRILLIHFPQQIFKNAQFSALCNHQKIHLVFAKHVIYVTQIILKKKGLCICISQKNEEEDKHMANKSLTAAKYLATMHLEYQNFLIIGKTLPVHHPQNKREPEPASKLSQEADEADETTNDDDNSSSMVAKEEEKTEKKRRGTYRTKAKAGKIDKMPDYLPVITHKDYLSALTINKDSTTHLLLLPDSSKLEYEDKTLYLDGKIVNYDELTKLSTEDGIEKFNFPLLAELFGVILYKFLADDSKKDCKDEEFTVYYPDLAGRFRKSKAKKKKTEEDVSDYTKQKDVSVTISDWKTESASVLSDNMALFERMAGIINAGTPDQFILPLLTDYGYDPVSNTFHFKSPYMTKLISEIHKTSIKKDKKGKPIIKNGKLQMSPAYSFLVNREIARERNKKAIEIVIIIIALIERAGGFKPHIRAKNIIERTWLLNHSLIGQNTSNKNLLLKRAFSKAWELLDTKTALKNVYTDIQFPKTENIPTSSKLDKVFEFPHKGKNT